MKNKSKCAFDIYFSDLNNLCVKIISECDFDCIVALKRSGWILGSILSNKTNKPVFTPSEIDSIPDKFKKVIIVDDKIHKGKSIRKVLNKLKHKKTYTACLYVEGDVFPDIYIRSLNNVISKMWYEKNW